MSLGSGDSVTRLSSLLNFFGGEADCSNRALLTAWGCLDRMWLCCELLSQLDRSREAEPDVERYWRLLSALPSEMRRVWPSSLRLTRRWEMSPPPLCTCLLKLPRNRSRLPLEIIEPRMELLFMLLLRLCWCIGGVRFGFIIDITSYSPFCSSVL